MGIAPAALVTGATRTPLPYGLLSAFTPRPASGERWESGVSWETGTCDPVDGIGAVECGPPQIQVFTVDGNPTSGTWRFVSAERGNSSTITRSATVGAVQTALDGLIGNGKATVTGTTGGPYTVTWASSGPDEPLSTSNTFDVGSVLITTTPGDSSQVAFGLPKDLTSNKGENGEATEFTVYGHFNCSPVGYSAQAAQDMATMHLLSREEARVEQAFWSGDLGNVPNLADDATTLGGGAVPLATGVALLEDFLATEYGSLGVIHMTRGTATICASEDLVNTTGGRLTTTLGTPVVAGAGYPGTSPAGAAAAVGRAWLYASPAIFGYRSEVFTSSNRGGDLFDRAQNDLFAVAERTYLLGYDPCGVAAVEVLLPVAAP